MSDTVDDTLVGGGFLDGTWTTKVERARQIKENLFMFSGLLLAASGRGGFRSWHREPREVMTP